jgi:dTMP kinase
MSDAPSVGPAPAAGAAAAPAAATATSTPPPRGAFILLEGLDRSGKSSQCLRLAEALNAQNKDAALSMRFPDRTTAIGQMIDAYLKQSAHIDDQSVFGSQCKLSHCHVHRAHECSHCD